MLLATISSLTLEMPMPDICPICGAAEFTSSRVLWPELIAQWGLASIEVDYVDHQQGTTCRGCYTQVRGMALAKAILAYFGESEPLRTVLARPELAALSVADMNGCAGVSPSFGHLANYHRIDFPEFNMMALPFEPETFDLVFHSDTLEHVADPIAALRECLRVLKPDGLLCFTAPVIVDRQSRSRENLPHSYHGGPDDPRQDFLVRHEFGADIWKVLAGAGAEAIASYFVDYPAGIAWSAGKSSTSHRSLAGASRSVEVAKAREPVIPGDVYSQDGLHTVHNHEFVNEPAFRRAYARGVQAAGDDYKWHWRVHVALWAAEAAIRLPGDFVECGVNRGFLSSAIMELLDWDRTGRTFYLLDTFNGIDPSCVSDAELSEGILDKNQASIASGFYVDSVDEVRANFSQWRNQRIVVGTVPDTLNEVRSEQIAFLSLDMNCTPPEVAALEHFWDRLSDGALVILDDYAYTGYRQQKLGIDECAARLGVGVLSLPTGQGLIVRPPRLQGRSPNHPNGLDRLWRQFVRRTA